MSERLHISKKSNANLGTTLDKKFQSRPFTTQRVTDCDAPLTQQEIENQQYQQDRFETTKLEIQAKYGTITPQGQERLNLLQAKKAEYWERYMAPVRSYNLDLGHISITRAQAEAKSKKAIQAKLTIGAPGDKYEQEADRVATLVVNQINAPVSQHPSQNVQREAMPEKDELQIKSETESIQREDMPEEELQMKPMLQLQAGDGGMAAPAELETSIQQARSGGQPLADHVRKPMERAFGADFSGVKVHADTQADQLNQSIQARAFTTGQDVFFQQGEYQPGSRGGQELLAHELTHVVQQNGGAVMRSPLPIQVQLEAMPEDEELQAKSILQRQDTIGGGKTSTELASAINAARGGGQPLEVGQRQVVQRAIAADGTSNAELKGIFDGLLTAESVGALTDQIGTAVRIRYGNAEEMEGRHAFFLLVPPTIVIDQTLTNLADIRHYILVELNHARLPGGPVAAPQPANADDFDADDLNMYTAALDATRVEYHEWVSAYLTHLETLDTNLTLGAPVDDNIDLEMEEEQEQPAPVNAVTPRYAAAFAQPGEGWFSFETYLEIQVNSGHTAAYDNQAINQDWAGFQLLDMVMVNQPELLTITADQHEQFVLDMIQNPVGLQAAMFGRANPFAGATGTQLLTDAMETVIVL